MAYIGTKPANQVIDSTLIADGTVTTADIADNAITTAKIAAGAVVEADIADSAVTTAKIANGAVTAGKLASTLDLTGKTVTLPAGTGGKVLQVVNATRAATSVTTSTSFVSNGLTASITPSSSSSKIFVSVSSVGDSGASGVTAFYTLYRNSTNLGGATEGLGGVSASSGNIRAPIAFNYLDSPSTTSSVSYTLYFRSINGTLVEVPPYASGVQVITLMEIAG